MCGRVSRKLTINLEETLCSPSYSGVDTTVRESNPATIPPAHKGTGQAGTSRDGSAVEWGGDRTDKEMGVCSRWDEHARFAIGHYPGWALAPTCPRGMGHRRHAGTRSFRGFYPQLRFLPSRTRPGRLDGDSRGGSCGVDIRAQSPWCAGFRYSGPGLPEPRRRALLAQTGRLDGHVYLVVLSCIRDSAGRPFGESGTLLPWMALVCGRRGSTIFLHYPNHSTIRSLSRRWVCPPLGTMAHPLLDPIERSDDLPTTRLLVGSCRHDRDRRRVCAGLSLPVHLYTHRETTNQMGALWYSVVAAAYGDAQRALHPRVEPSSWQASPLVDSYHFSRLVARVSHRAFIVEHRCTSLSPLRHRCLHQPDPRLRLAHPDARIGVFRECCHFAVRLPRPHRTSGTAAIGHRSLHPGDRRAFQPLKTAHPVLHRQALLPQQVRRQKDPGSVLCQAQGRNGPGGAKR